MLPGAWAAHLEADLVFRWLGWVRCWRPGHCTQRYLHRLGAYWEVTDKALAVLHPTVVRRIALVLNQAAEDGRTGRLVVELTLNEGQVLVSLEPPLGPPERTESEGP